MKDLAKILIDAALGGTSPQALEPKAPVPSHPLNREQRRAAARGKKPGIRRDWMRTNVPRSMKQ